MMNSKPDDTPSVASGTVVVDVNSKSPAAEPKRKTWWRSKPCLIIAAVTALDKLHVQLHEGFLSFTSISRDRPL